MTVALTDTLEAGLPGSVLTHYRLFIVPGGKSSKEGNDRRCSTLRRHEAQLSRTRQPAYGRPSCLVRTCFLECLSLLWGIEGWSLAVPGWRALCGFRVGCPVGKQRVWCCSAACSCRSRRSCGRRSRTSRCRCTCTSSTEYDMVTGLTGCGVQQSAGYVTESRGRLPSVHTDTRNGTEQAKHNNTHHGRRTCAVRSCRTRREKKLVLRLFGGEAFCSALNGSQDGRSWRIWLLIVIVRIIGRRGEAHHDPVGSNHVHWRCISWMHVHVCTAQVSVLYVLRTDTRAHEAHKTCKSYSTTLGVTVNRRYHQFISTSFGFTMGAILFAQLSTQNGNSWWFKEAWNIQYIEGS